MRPELLTELKKIWDTQINQILFALIVFILN